MLIALLGTSASLAKNLALALIVSSVNVIIWVPEDSSSSGSLNAICPLFPTPKSWISIPPSYSIFLSYSLHSNSKSLASPLGTKVFFISTLIYLNKFSFIKCL